ncbi:MAG TPA: YraN family protein [Deltaproteobacteria bacterium]|nr:YraN family protein [Deltaproteobacteria bacterium]
MYGESTRAKGARGEEIASAHLEREGFRILEKNFHARIGEIDIVAIEENTLVFVEVKHATGTSFGDPLEWIPVRKQERIIKASRFFVKKHGLHHAQMRFDVVAVGPDRRVVHVRDAFRPGDMFSV